MVEKNSKTIECPFCGYQISKYSLRCSICGNRLLNKITAICIILVSLAIFLFIYLKTGFWGIMVYSIVLLLYIKFINKKKFN